jgi:hypothetical protein
MYAQSPEKLIAKGEYEEALSECVDRLEKGKGNKDKLYASLKTSFDEANQQSLDHILAMKAEGEPKFWYDIYTEYLALQTRYTLVSGIQDQLMADHVNITLVDYSLDLEASKHNAIAYLYAHSVSLLESGEEPDAAQAYLELLNITQIDKDYKDVALLLRQAIGGSAGLARLEVKNRSDATLSPDFLAGMEEISLSYKEKQYLDYVVKVPPGVDPPLSILVTIESVVVTPGSVNEKEYTTSHKNPESFENAYDDEAKKEEDKKHPDYNKCKITEIYQVKSAVMKGKVKYIDAATGKVLYIVPVKAVSIFENKTATAEGDLYACPPEVYEILDKPKKKFPKNAEMIMDAGKEFKILVKEVVWNDAFIK